MRSQRLLTKGDWLSQAMELLRTSGVGGVRVLRLANALKVTRGSFYWHFRDREDLLDQMLDWWDREMTGTVVRFADDLKKKDAGKRVLALAEFILRSDRARYDTAIWSWAEADGKARKVLRRVLQKRLAYITGLFRDAGFPRAEASARGHLLAIYLMGEKAIHADQDLATRLRLLRRQVRTLTRPS